MAHRESPTKMDIAQLQRYAKQGLTMAEAARLVRVKLSGVQKYAASVDDLRFVDSPDGSEEFVDSPDGSEEPEDDDQ